jgi:phosphotriesterase-related protein
MDQLDIIESEGGRADRFISIHTQAEPDWGLHRAVAERGAWIEYDNVGAVAVTETADLILRALHAGLSGQLLVSHDRGWFDPALPGGGTPLPYTVLNLELLPLLRQLGVDGETIDRLTHKNPFAAFARP